MKKMPFVAEISAITLAAAMAMNAMAETVNTVSVTKFNQPYPYTGKATVEYTVHFSWTVTVALDGTTTSTPLVVAA